VTTEQETAEYGFAWNVVNPLATILVYTVIFAQIMRTRLPGVDNTFGYSISFAPAFSPGGLFAEITSRSQTMFIETCESSEEAEISAHLLTSRGGC